MMHTISESDGGSRSINDVSTHTKQYVIFYVLQSRRVYETQAKSAQPKVDYFGDVRPLDMDVDVGMDAESAAQRFGVAYKFN